jgi:small subunit ribosomal protein S20
MPHTESAWKRLRQADKRRRRNRVVAKSIKEKRKELTVALKGTDEAVKTAQTKVVQQALDRAATKGYIHKNKAARLKSRVAKKLKAQTAAK